MRPGQPIGATEKKKKKPKVGVPISSPRIPRFDRSIVPFFLPVLDRSSMNIHARAATYAEHPSSNEAGPRTGEMEVDGCRLISPIAAVSCSSIDSPYSPPPPRATATFLRGLLINGESINGGLRGIPKKSQRGGGKGIDPPDRSWNEEEIFFLTKKWNRQLGFDCSSGEGLLSLEERIKIRSLTRLFRSKYF